MIRKSVFDVPVDVAVPSGVGRSRGLRLHPGSRFNHHRERESGCGRISEIGKGFFLLLRGRERNKDTRLLETGLQKDRQRNIIRQKESERERN